MSLLIDNRDNTYVFETRVWNTELLSDSASVQEMLQRHVLAEMHQRGITPPEKEDIINSRVEVSGMSRRVVIEFRSNEVYGCGTTLSVGHGERWDCGMIYPGEKRDLCAQCTKRKVINYLDSLGAQLVDASELREAINELI